MSDGDFSLSFSLSHLSRLACTFVWNLKQKTIIYTVKYVFALTVMRESKYQRQPRGRLIEASNAQHHKQWILSTGSQQPNWIGRQIAQCVSLQSAYTYMWYFNEPKLTECDLLTFVSLLIAYEISVISIELTSTKTMMMMTQKQSHRTNHVLTTTSSYFSGSIQLKIFR